MHDLPAFFIFFRIFIIVFLYFLYFLKILLALSNRIMYNNFNLIVTAYKNLIHR